MSRELNFWYFATILLYKEVAYIKKWKVRNPIY